MDKKKGKQKKAENAPLDLRNEMELQWLDPKTLKPNADNPKQHGAGQRKNFNEFMMSYGWLGALLLNKRTGNLLDGHMRQDEAVLKNMPEVPVLVVDVPEEEEADVIAYLDSVGRLYTMNMERLRTIKEQVTDKSSLLRDLLVNTRPSGEILAGIAMEDDDNGASPKKKVNFPEGGLSLVLGAEYDYVVLMFDKSFDFTVASDHFGLERKACVFHKSQVGIGRVVNGPEYLHRILPMVRAYQSKESE